jgi:hypothetical protein
MCFLQANGQPEGTAGATDDNTDTNDSAASGPESSLSPSEAHDVPLADMEDSSASESVTPAAQPAQRVNPLKWTVSLLHPASFPMFLVKSAVIIIMPTDLAFITALN